LLHQSNQTRNTKTPGTVKMLTIKTTAQDRKFQIIKIVAVK